MRPDEFNWRGKAGVVDMLLVWLSVVGSSSDAGERGFETLLHYSRHCYIIPKK